VPKLNRVRIANFSFGARHITDELFNFYDGENVLLNLANGGGKSVVVQAMLQPVLPCEVIHKRHVESYVAGNKSPIFIMLEWKLDNTVHPKYLMTGIVLSRTDSGDDNSGKVRYFTFAGEYAQANDYDIKNIPLVSHNGREVSYLSHDAAANVIKEAEKKGKLQYFHSENKKKYYDLLKTYGIYENEWKLIARMNDEEGGIDKLFEECRTSDNIIDKWVLKTIEETILGNENAESLSKMFHELIKQVMEQKENLNSKNELQAFLSEIGYLLQPLEQLLIALDEKDSKEQETADYYFAAQNSINELALYDGDILKKLAAIVEILNHIELEKLSEDYYNKSGKYEAVLKSCEMFSENLTQSNEQYMLSKKNKELCDAAKKYDKIIKFADKLAASLSHLSTLRDKNGSDVQLKNVEYSLKVAYEKELAQMELSRLEFCSELVHIKESEQSYHSRKNELIESQKKNQNHLGWLNSKTEEFKKLEKLLFLRLSIFLNRNLLAVLEEDEIKAVQNTFFKQQQQLSNEKDDLEGLIKTNAAREVVIKVQESKLHENELKLAGKTETLRNDLLRYNAEESVLKSVLERRNINFERRFDSEMLSHGINEQKLSIEKRLYEASKELDVKTEMHRALLSGGIHVSTEICKLLFDADVNYKTGEAYLREQSRETQERLLKINPMLPFCLLVPKNELPGLSKIDADYFIRNIVPVMAFEDVETQFACGEKMAKLSDTARAFCFFRKESFAFDSKDEFEQYLLKEISEYDKRVKAYRLETDGIVKDIEIVFSFKYTAQHKIGLQKEIADCQSSSQRIRETIETLSNEEKILAEKTNKAIRRMSECEKEAEKCAADETAFADYLSSDEEYRSNLREIGKIYADDESTKKEIEKIETLMQEDRIHKESLNSELQDHKREMDEMRHKQERFQGCEAAELLDESLSMLEQKHFMLTSSYANDIRKFEDDIKRDASEKNELQTELDKHYGQLDIWEYQSISYSAARYDTLCEAYDKREKELTNARDEFHNAEIQKARAETSLEDAKTRLNEKGLVQPFSESEIRQNYEVRIADAKAQRQTLLEQSKKAESKKKVLENACVKITHIIDIHDFRQKCRLTLPEDLLFIIEGNTQELTKLKHDNKKKNEDLNETFEKINKTFENKHKVINSFLNGLVWKRSADDYLSYFSIYEKLTDSIKFLNDTISVINSALENMERYKNSVIEQCHMQGIMLYNEIKRISDSSYVRLPERKTPAQMLRIEVPQELDQQTQQRMSMYIDSCIDILRKQGTVQKAGNELQRQVANMVSNRQLLNVMINKTTIAVKLYKVDINQKNSGLKAWEETVVESSGGEKFVACFTMISSLIAYTRAKIKEETGETPDGDTRVFIIDNPFGKTSSKHLLEVMVKIAEKFDTQLVCLSDLSQSSITNRFALIYQLAVKTAMYSNKSYLKTEEIIKNSDDLHSNERLEHIILKTQEQTSFLDV
jgi:hypothetical protein